MIRAIPTLMIAAMLAATATKSDAACTQWNVSRLILHQQPKLAASPIKYLVYFYMSQSGTQLTGRAEYYHAVNPPRPNTGLKGALGGKGSASGFVRGNTIELTANWAPNSVGVYAGTISTQGMSTGNITGVTYDRRNPGARMDWHSAGPLSCVRSN